MVAIEGRHTTYPARQWCPVEIIGREPASGFVQCLCGDEVADARGAAGGVGGDCERGHTIIAVSVIQDSVSPLSRPAGHQLLRFKCSLVP